MYEDEVLGIHENYDHKAIRFKSYQLAKTTCIKVKYWQSKLAGSWSTYAVVTKIVTSFFLGLTRLRAREPGFGQFVFFLQGKNVGVDYIVF